jgi:TRAP-type C4-dicarboxylate transport system substrate-binding protein
MQPKIISNILIGLLVNLTSTVLLYGADLTRINLATLAPRGSSPHQILQSMGEKWSKNSTGKVTLNIYPDGNQGGEAAVVRQMRLSAGTVQAALLTAQGLGEIDKSISGLEDIPMAYRSLDEAEYVRSKLRAKIEKGLRDKGFVLLFWGDAGWVRFFSRDRVVSPTDLNNMKLFSWAGNAEQEEIMKSAGWNPVPLETSLIYSSLKTKKIDAVPTIPLAANDLQYFSSCPYMLELNWAPLVVGAVVKASVWDALDAATQANLRKAADEAGAELTSRTRGESDQAVEAMKKRGLKVTLVPPQLDAAWRSFAEGFYSKVRGKIVPEAMFDEVQQLLKDFRASRQSTPRAR